MTADDEEAAARSRVRDWARRAASALEPRQSLRAATPTDVAAVAAVYGVDRLPAAVEEFLLVAGHPLSAANSVFNPEILGVDIMLRGWTSARQTARQTGFDDSAWEHAILVAVSSNETVMWVYPEHPDPAVHGLNIGGETGVWDERFTDYLEWALESYQSAPR